MLQKHPSSESGLETMVALEHFPFNASNCGHLILCVFDKHDWSCVAEGVCEIWLTSEDTGAYGRDIGTDLPSLLWELVKEIPEGAMLRLGMTNPPYILEHLEVRPYPHTNRRTTHSAHHC